MKIVYTQKGLEFRKELRHDIEVSRYRAFHSPEYRNTSKFTFKPNMHTHTSFKNHMQETDRSFKLPDFDNVKVEVIKTARGEVKERPLVLAKELEKDKNCEVTQYNLDEKNSIILRKLLNDRPPNIHRKASLGMILPPKAPQQSNSVVDIIGTVESPSHWRYFENKKKQYNRFLSPQSSSHNSSRKCLPKMKQRHFSPELTQNYSPVENKFPFNVEKIFRKHAEEQEKRQMLR